MRLIRFTAEDRCSLAHDRFHHPDPRVQRKMEVLWLKSHGLNHDAIAVYADVSRRTVQRYLDEYLEGGLPRLRHCPLRTTTGDLARHRDSLEEYFLGHPPRSAKHAQTVIEKLTGVRRGLTQVRHFLKDQLGLRWRKTGAIPVPPKKSVEEHARDQAVFRREELEPRLKQARRGRRQVYFVDAAHFVFAPFLEARFRGASPGGVLEDRTVVFAGLLAEPEPDRAAVAVPAQGVAGLDVLRGLRAIHIRYRPVPGRITDGTQG